MKFLCEGVQIQTDRHTDNQKHHLLAFAEINKVHSAVSLRSTFGTTPIDSCQPAGHQPNSPDNIADKHSQKVHFNVILQGITAQLS